jgi:tetratricopeptide (TPR) repeat protein
MKQKALIGGIVAIIVFGFGIQYWYQTHPALPDLPVIVMLPTQVSDTSNLAFLSDAIPATVSSQLKGIPGIEVKRPPTTIEVAAVAGNNKRIAQAYDANLVATSELSSDNDNFHIDLQIVDPNTQKILRKNSFDGTKSQYLDFTRQIAESLRGALRESSQSIAPANVAGGSDAELAFREGEYFLDAYNNRHDSADFDAALSAFQSTLQLDPQSANAAANIARLYQMRSVANGGDAPMLTEALNWARRSLDLDAKCGRAYFTLSILDPANRLPHLLRAATYASDFASAQLDLAAAMAASSNLALAASRQSRMIDPLNLYAPLSETDYLHQLGRVTEAFSILDRYVVSIEPNMVYGRWAEASLMIELGWLEKAGPYARDIDKDVAEQRLMPLASNMMRQKLTIARNEFGAEGIEIPRILSIVRNPGASPMEIAVAVESVPMLANTSYIDEAFEILGRAVQANVILPYDWLQLDHRLEKLRKDARFGPVINKSREQFDELMKALDEAKGRGELPSYLQPAITDVRSQLGI